MNKKFLLALKRAYSEVLKSNKKTTVQNIRIQSAHRMVAAFNLINYQIKGSENLPYKSGTIFIYNHLINHPYFTVDENFQLTLDSHFISSKILYNYYKDPGNRLVRHAIDNELNHQAYYDALDYIKVYSKDFIPTKISKKDIKTAHEKFKIKALECLKQEKGLVYSPEGSSYSTEDSPGVFKSGVFKLAASIKDQPYIVPLVMTGFDKLPSQTVYKCEIMPAFKMSDFGIESAENPEIMNFTKEINNNYKVWVSNLSKDDLNFKSEIDFLKSKINNKINKKDMVVFYGSSTIRLWKTIDEDFKKYNILNLGFGGAFIHSLRHYFESLFGFKSPKAIVLYLGGNDLNLDYSAEKITAMIREFIEIINQKFPETHLFNISIKPSLERIDKLKTIKTINQLMDKLSHEKKFLTQVNFYQKMIDRGVVKKEFLLKDGLHLNTKGYELLKEILEAAFLKAKI